MAQNRQKVESPMYKLAIAALLGAGSIVALGGITGGKISPNQFTKRGFPIHTQETAPAQTKEVLDWYQENFQMVPHLAGVMAESPALIRSYWELQKNLDAIGSLTPAENNIVQMSIAFENKCQYCVAGHTMAGRMFFDSTEDQLQSLRSGSPLEDPKLETLRTFAISVYESKGRISDAELRAFYDAGYTRKQALDVVANIAAKVMTNYTNQVALTPVDEQFKPFTEGLPFQENRSVRTHP